MDANKKIFLTFACIRVHSRLIFFAKALPLVGFVVSSIIENFANDYNQAGLDIYQVPNVGIGGIRKDELYMTQNKIDGIIPAFRDPGTARP